MADPRKPTDEEAEAILTLVRGGWLKLELTLGDLRIEHRGSGGASVAEQINDGN